MSDCLMCTTPTLLIGSFSQEAANTNFIVFVLTSPGLEPTIYKALGELYNTLTTITQPRQLNKITYKLEK